MEEKNVNTEGLVIDDCQLKKSNRRRFLSRASGVVGGGAGLSLAFPFLSSLGPSQKAEIEGAPVKASVKNLIAGELRRVLWRMKPIWLFGRDQSMLELARKNEAQLVDPDSENSLQPSCCKNEFRSIKPNVFVVVGICTHLGCSPGESLNGVFLCACHGSKFDVAGRVFYGSPAPTNLIVPYHHYLNDDEIIIGQDKSA